MLNGTDYYLTASSYDLLAGMLTTVQDGFIQIAYNNIIGPKTDGTNWYVAIRISPEYDENNNLINSVTLPSGVTEDDVNGPVVLGVWE